MKYFYLVICLTIIGSSLYAQRNRLAGVSGDKLYLINPETAETEEIVEINEIGDKRIRDLIYVREDSLFYGIIDSRDEPGLVSIDWDGNFVMLGKLGLPEGAVYTCEGLAYHSGTNTLWASVSLDGDDFFSESIVTVSLTDASCEYIGELKMTGRRADADNLEFLGDRLFIDDGMPAPFNRTTLYTLELSVLMDNNGDLTPIIDSESDYQSSQDLAAFSVDKMYYTTAGSELGEWQLPSGDTRNQPFPSLESSDVMTGLAVVPGEKGTTSVRAFSEVEVVLFPNPASTHINVLPKANYSCQLFDLQGRMVRESSGDSVNVIGGASGIYYLRIDGGRLRKVVVQSKTVYP
ncbi:T9SS type A sorting domain-containing protein [Neolewinella agarilytica]|uniref:Por secretion system C-terminal sorting domain-containing protein n=1 Tax=Neolewinella agarilytica TaxID=478744 RepID=A0A1H9E122_9BACT|nr:T9SS type A sorting domain-containing protein [Neolewinella agarilytica]SEQ19426.1 Por secretion system C-terminal sorting domain-containing protein [Neolewinella agarilytica]